MNDNQLKLALADLLPGTIIACLDAKARIKFGRRLFIHWVGSENLVTDGEWLEVVRQGELILNREERSEYESWLEEGLGQRQTPHACFRSGVLFLFINATWQHRAESLIKTLQGRHK